MNRRHWSLDITVSVLEFRSLCSDTNPTTTACRHDTHFMLSLIKLSMSLIQKACSSPPCNTQKCWIISSAQREQGRRWRTRVALGPLADNVESSGWIIQDGVGLQHPSDCVEKDAQLMPLNTQLSHTSSWTTVSIIPSAWGMNESYQGAFSLCTI